MCGGGEGISLCISFFLCLFCFTTQEGVDGDDLMIYDLREQRCILRLAWAAAQCSIASENSELRVEKRRVKETVLESLVFHLCYLVCYLHASVHRNRDVSQHWRA